MLFLWSRQAKSRVELPGAARTHEKQFFNSKRPCFFLKPPGGEKSEQAAIQPAGQASKKTNIEAEYRKRKKESEYSLKIRFDVEPRIVFRTSIAFVI